MSILGLHNTEWPEYLPCDESGRNIEILTNVNAQNIEEFFRARIGVYDIVWLSRTHNLLNLKAWRNACPEFFSNLSIVLDTEAIAATRRFAYAQLAKQPSDLSSILLEEMEHLDGISHICVVNELDKDLIVRMLQERGLQIPVSILGHALRLQPKFPTFLETTDIVLTGSFSQPDGPNADALLWFDREVRPLLGDMPALRFIIAGSKAARFVELTSLQHDYTVISDPPEMETVLASARVMVAPTRFAGGMPMKVHEAASYGVPVAMTELLASQLGWFQEDIARAPTDPALFADIIRNLATNPREWQAVQTAQATLVVRDCKLDVFEAVIRQIISNPNAPTSVADQTVNELIGEKQTWKAA
jgi:hypothetical protein